MTITPVDERPDLFYVEDVYPQELLEQMTEQYALSAPWRREDMQADWLRRRLDNTELVNEFDSYIKSCASTIEQAINFPVLYCDTGFWLDEPGFTVSRHVDNAGVAASMQVYMWNNPALPGTAFYSDSEVRRQFEYKQNTGYLMINGPTQQHGMTASVPDNNYRLCSYTWFYPKV
jgi:hypothetical protein